MCYTGIGRGHVRRETLSSATDSRTNGALSRVSLQCGSHLSADCERYAATDSHYRPTKTLRVEFDPRNRYASGPASLGVPFHAVTRERSERRPDEPPSSS